MKYGFYLFLTIALIFGAYTLAQSKIKRPLNLASVQLGMSPKDVARTFGSPSAQTRNVLTYILHDGSELTITLRDKKVSSAQVKFQRPAKIEDPEMKKLTLVQMDHNLENNDQSWFFAGQPEEGLIYKITSEGLIESLTWVPPFSIGQNRPKNLQALLSDFRSQRRL